MFDNELDREAEGWTPFRVVQKPVERAGVPSFSKAREVNPITVMSRSDRAIVQPVAPEVDDEAKAAADDDPKALASEGYDSSVTSNAKVSEIDSGKSGSSQTPDQNLIHPSSLPPSPESPASVTREESQPLVPSLLMTNPGQS